MFQYAFGKNIAIKNGCELKFDLSFYNKSEPRSYSLDHFSITEKIASQREIESLKQKHFTSLNKIKRRLFSSKPYFVHQQGFEFNPDYLKTQPDVYLDGYWQSEKFFINSSEQIRKDFQVKTPPNAANRDLLAQFESRNAVSLHIRRGDFQTNPVFNKIHGTCSLDYYQQATRLIAEKVQHPIFYVFSDDLKWAKLNLKVSYEMNFVDINDDKSAFEDLRLISNCKHHILANSSFSWWGAWLNENSDKTIIAPKTWFADAELNRHAASIVPDRWIRI